MTKTTTKPRASHSAQSRPGARPPQSVRIDEIMTPSPVIVRDSASIGDAWDLLRTLDIRHLPVVNADRELVGIVSDRDFTSPPGPPLMAELVGNRPAALDAPVASIMTGAPISVGRDDDIRDAIEAMLDNKVGAIPVVGPEGEVVGIVSYLDVLRVALA